MEDSSERIEELAKKCAPTLKALGVPEKFLASEPETVRLEFSGTLITRARRKPNESDQDFAERVWWEEESRDLAECLELDGWLIGCDENPTEDG